MGPLNGSLGTQTILVAQPDGAHQPATSAGRYGRPPEVVTGGQVGIGSEACGRGRVRRSPDPCPDSRTHDGCRRSRPLVTTRGRPSTIVMRADGSSAPATLPENAVVGPTDPSASETSQTIGFFAQPATQHVVPAHATPVACRR